MISSSFAYTSQFLVRLYNIALTPALKENYVLLSNRTEQNIEFSIDLIKLEHLSQRGGGGRLKVYAFASMAGRVGMAVGRIAQLTSRCSGRRELSSCASTGEAMVRAERRGPFSPCSRVRRAFNGSTDCSAAVGVRWAHGSGRDDVACASTQSSPR